jgi:TolA-binding protein
MNESPSYNRIERYLLGQMEPQERAAFEAEVVRDPVLAEQLAVQQREHQALELLVEEHLRPQLKQWAEQYPLRRPTPWYRQKAIWMAAASLLLLGILYLTWPSEQKPDNALVETESPLPPIEPLPAPPTEDKAAIGETPPEEASTETTAQRYIALAARYTERPKFQRIVVRNEQAELSYMDSAYLALEKGQYTRAIRRLRQIPPGDDHYISAQHLIGEAFFASGAYAKAIPYLQVAANTPDYLRKSEAEWQWALAWLHLASADNSRRVLQRIVKDATHPYCQKAKQLLTEVAQQQQ